MLFKVVNIAFSNGGYSCFCSMWSCSATVLLAAGDIGRLVLAASSINKPTKGGGMAPKDRLWQVGVLGAYSDGGVGAKHC